MGKAGSVMAKDSPIRNYAPNAEVLLGTGAWYSVVHHGDSGTRVRSLVARSKTVEVRDKMTGEVEKSITFPMPNPVSIISSGTPVYDSRKGGT